MQTVSYQGETIHLSRTYADFHALRDDADNLLASEIPRVARLVRSALIPQSLLQHRVPIARKHDAEERIVGLTP